MIVTLALLAASQVPAAADLDELRWRRFARAAVLTETPFSSRMGELRRSVRQLPLARAPRGHGLPGPSGL